MQDQLFDMLIKENEITWQTILQDLIKSEQMNPWDINVTLLANRYMETIKKLQDHNFFISGKIVLAASMLLRIKSYKLVNDDIANFDDILFNTGEDMGLMGDLDDIDINNIKNNKVTIIPRVPQPRKRKVTMEDLMVALNKALEVKQRRVMRRIREDDAPKVIIPEQTVDISVKIKLVYKQIKDFFAKTFGKEKLTFTKLVPTGSKHDKIYTFIPLLQLSNEEKVDLYQKEHFEEIYINLLENSPGLINPNLNEEN